MLAGFYGLSAITLTLSPLSITSFTKLVNSLDTPTNRIILSYLKRDFEECIKTLESMDSVYESPDARRMSVMLRQGRYNTEEEKLELEEKLSREKKILSPMFSKEGSLSKLSEGAYVIIKRLYNNLDKMKFFYNNLNYGDKVDDGLTAFGERLYILRIQSEYGLINRLTKLYKVKHLSKGMLDNLEHDVKVLSSYLVDKDSEDGDTNWSSLEESFNSIKDLIIRMNSNYFNEELGLDLSDEEYYKITMELSSIGLVGFSIYTESFMNDFLSKVSLSNTTNLRITQDKPLYSIVERLEEVVENYEILWGGK